MTIDEMKARMSNAELQTWVAYVEENGPLNPSLRIEAAVARAVAPFLKNVKPRDLMPFPKQPEPEATPEMLLAMFKNAATKTRMN